MAGHIWLDAQLDGARVIEIIMPDMDMPFPDMSF
jgi:hypothetical protein